MNMAPVTIRPVDSERYVEIKELYKHNLASLNNYIEELQWWNKRVNLVSRDVSRETLVKHVEHSLLLLLVPIVNEAANIFDVGTGGGLPGTTAFGAGDVAALLRQEYDRAQGGASVVVLSSLLGGSHAPAFCVPEASHGRPQAVAFVWMYRGVLLSLFHAGRNC